MVATALTACENTGPPATVSALLADQPELAFLVALMTLAAAALRLARDWRSRDEARE